MYPQKGFTLMELLVVLAIIGIMLTAVTPMIGSRVTSGGEQNAFFSELLKQHLQLAREEGTSVSITGFKGSANILKYDGTRDSIPGIKSVQSALVNGELTEGLEYEIRVYPDGLCDHFVLEANDGTFIESSPLTMNVRRYRL